MNKQLTGLRRIWRFIRMKLYRLTGEWRPLIEKPLPAAEVDEVMKAASIPTGGFFFLLALSSAIATFGLIGNSAPAIIGAMVIAPLMVPIMGLSYGLINLEWPQIVRSLLSVTTGVILVVLLAYLSAQLIGLRITGSEMVSRALPSLLDLGVAIAAGAAAAFAYSRESIRNSIAGVAIAVALVPPLAATGIGLALGRKATADVGLSLGDLGLYAGGSDIASGAFVLFLTNLVGIIVVAGVVLVSQGYGSWKRAVLGLTLITGGGVLLFAPLEKSLHKLYVKNETVRLLRTMPLRHPDWLTPGGRLDALTVRYQDDLLHVRLEGAASQHAIVEMQRKVHVLRRYLTDAIGEPLVVEIEAIPVKFVNFQSAPETEGPTKPAWVR